MSDLVSLPNIPADALHLAQTLSVQTGISLSAIFRLALVSGVLVECTKVGPDLQGRYAGREALWLAKALRRHLSSAIDLLMEQGQHPQNTTGGFWVISHPVGGLFPSERAHPRGDRGTGDL
jgi:hypothetical protein